MESKQVILRAENIQKYYQTGRLTKLHVLKGIDLTVHEGEIIAVVGPSGVGKSTLLHILGTLDRPSAGEVYLDGIQVFNKDEFQLAQFRNRTTGFVFQFHHLLPEFTALENVMMPAMISGYSRSQCQARALGLLGEVSLTNRGHHRPGELSGGEQQRVAVARALMNDPRLILADEPSGNLDLQASRDLNDLLWHLSRKYRKTFIIVTHNMELAQRSDRIIELYDGRVKN